MHQDRVSRISENNKKSYWSSDYSVPVYRLQRFTDGRFGLDSLSSHIKRL